MIDINWNPVAHLGPIPINWYGLGWAAAFVTGWSLTLHSVARYGIVREQIDDLVLWILIGTMGGARLYFIVQNDPLGYLREPWLRSLKGR